MSRVYEVNNLRCERRIFQALILEKTVRRFPYDIRLISLWTKPSRVNTTLLYTSNFTSLKLNNNSAPVILWFYLLHSHWENYRINSHPTLQRKLSHRFQIDNHTVNSEFRNFLSTKTPLEEDMTSIIWRE